MEHSWDAVGDHGEHRSRLALFVSVACLVVGGAGITAIDTVFLKGEQPRRKAAALTKLMWKFETSDSAHLRAMDGIWSWRKLLLAGFMISTLAFSIASKFTTITYSLGMSAAINAIWFIGILGYWHFTFLPMLRRYDDAASKSNDTDPAYPAKDPRGTGTLGSPDTNEIKQTLKNKDSLDTTTKSDTRLPVTVITGFLGSGKTTLVKRILTNTKGLRVLVIENEIGSEGIDDHLLKMQQVGKEQIVLLSNGCVCCTVRQDLIDTFHGMFAHEAFDKLDWVVIETTGVADPSPVIQSLFMDRKCSERLRLDGVITVVDSKHLPLHVKAGKKDDYQGAHGGHIPEAVLQISFADRILLNKIDLLQSSVAEEDGGVTAMTAAIGGTHTSATVEGVKQLVCSINPLAQMLTCSHCDVPIDQLLNIKAFDPKHNKATMGMLSSSTSTLNDDFSSSASKVQAIQHDSPNVLVRRDETGKILQKKIKLNSKSRALSKEKLMADEKAIKASKAIISTVTLYTTQSISLDLFNQWMFELLQTQGESVYRAKGVLWMKGYDEQFVAQAVHMIFDGQRGPTWTAEEQEQESISRDSPEMPVLVSSKEVQTQGERHTQGERRSRLVFIGLNLDTTTLQEKFMACEATCVMNS